MSKPGALYVWLLAAALTVPPRSQAGEGGPEATAPLDGPGAVFQDPLLDAMIGTWRTTGTVLGEEVRYHVEVSWVLNHQFLLIQQRSEAPMGEGEPRYEAMVYIGRDHMSERYVAHWIDVFGGRASETLGFGVREGDALRFIFEYPSGPFRTTFFWDAGPGTWTWEMRTRTEAGEWVEFGRQRLDRASGG